MTDLTEQWKKGELPEGFYFVNDGAEVTIDYYLCDYWERHLDSHIYKILTPVPTFEEWEQLENWADFTNDYHELREKLEIAEYKNAQLKDLLKACRLSINGYPPYESGSEILRLTYRIDEVLK